MQQLTRPSWSAEDGDELLETFEAKLLPKTSGHLETMEPAKRQAMLRSIVVLEMEIERVEGQRKLNQHKSDEDYLPNRHGRAASALRVHAQSGARGLAVG